MNEPRRESVFTYAAPALKFGSGASAEVGHDLAAFGARRVLLVTDAGVAATGHPDRIADQCRARGLEVVVYADARVEPTDESMDAAIAFAKDAQSQGSPFDAVLAVGGGSSIDTAKAVNLLITNPGELMDYVNAPVGRSAGWLMPVFTCSDSTSSTQIVVLSAPVPVVVGTATSGSSALSGARALPTGALM